MPLALIIRCFIGAVIGAVVGFAISKICEAYYDFQLRRLKKRTDEALLRAYAPILELDQTRF
jgi:uncharacterized membrane protein YccC